MAALVKLRAVADTPSTRIEICDGAFTPLSDGQGLGTVETRVPPGLYEVTFSTCAQAVDRVVRVPADSPGPVTVRLRPEDLPIASAAPLYGAASTPPYQRQAAVRLSRGKPQRVQGGRGSWLFLFIRDVLGVAADYVSAGTTLHDADGNLLLDVTERCEADRSGAYAGLHLELKPGLYRLRVQTDSAGALEQNIVTCRGWQTQAFWALANYGNHAGDRRPDLARASVLMAGGGASRKPPAFDTDREETVEINGTSWAGKGWALRWAEQASQELARCRQVLPRQFYEYLLFARFDNPMFGIYGAHLLRGELARQGSSDPGGAGLRLLTTTVECLHKMLGPHPDVLALAALLPDTSINIRPFRQPPMLGCSWRCVLQASSASGRSRLLPARSLAAQISTRLRGGGCWLVWQVAPESHGAASAGQKAGPVPPQASVSTADLWRVFTRLVQHWSPNRAADAIRWSAHVAREQKLSPPEQMPLDYLVQTGVWGLLEYGTGARDAADDAPISGDDAVDRNCANVRGTTPRAMDSPGRETEGGLTPLIRRCFS